jgi:hypothetical protein
MRSWWLWGSVPARILLKLDEAIDTGELLMAHNDADGTVYRLDYGDMDAGALIECQWQSPKHDMGESWSIKSFRKLIFDFEDVAGGVLVEWEVDFGTASGSFTAQKRGSCWYGNSTNKISWLYNNSAGSQTNGGFYTAREAGIYVFNLPQSAMGRIIQITLSSTCGIPFQLNSYEVHFETKEQMYPDSEV